MQVLQENSEALSLVLAPENVEAIKKVIGDESVLGWSVFDANGVGVASDGVSGTVTAVCSNIIDLAGGLGEQLGEDKPRPAITFGRSGMEMYTLPIADVNILVVRNKTSGFRKEFSNARG